MLNIFSFISTRLKNSRCPELDHSLCSLMRSRLEHDKLSRAAHYDQSTCDIHTPCIYALLSQRHLVQAITPEL